MYLPQTNFRNSSFYLLYYLPNRCKPHYFISVKPHLFIVMSYIYIRSSFNFHLANSHVNSIYAQEDIFGIIFEVFLLIQSIYITHGAFYRGVCCSSFKCKLFSSIKDLKRKKTLLALPKMCQKTQRAA